MNLLALDTGTETMSIALARGTGAQQQVWEHTAPGGASASTHLIGNILELLATAGLQLKDLHAIAFGSGPGAFTGLRTACAVAQGLGFGASVLLLPVDSLMAVAEDARSRCGATAVTSLLDARMDELYVAHYLWRAEGWQTVHDCALVGVNDLALWLQQLPLQAQPQAASHVLAGNVFGVYAQRLQGAGAGIPRVEALPAAAAMLRMAPALLARGLAVPAEQAVPRYVRDKVAKTTLERAAEKAALSVARDEA